MRKLRHAYLIMAHGEFGVLRRLVAALDDEGNDIYVHIDRKVKKMPVLSTEHSSLAMLRNRINVKWGTVSQIRTELLLLETAAANGPYDFYHIISGTHLPLVSLMELNAFYDLHLGQEITRIWPEDAGDADFKLRRYHLFKSVNILWRACLKVQTVLGLRRNRDSRFIKTDNWMSLSERACAYLVGNKGRILKKYAHTHCADEYFAASELAEAGGFDLFDYPRLLHVRFKGANAETYPLSALEGLKDTNCLWARKFRE